MKGHESSTRSKDGMTGVQTCLGFQVVRGGHGDGRDDKAVRFGHGSQRTILSQSYGHSGQEHLIAERQKTDSTSTI